MHKHVISLAVAIGFGIGGTAFAADAMSKDAYKAEKANTTSAGSRPSNH